MRTDRYRIARERSPHSVEFAGIRHAAPWTTETADASQWDTYAEAATVLDAMNAARPKGRLFIVSEIDTPDGPAHAEEPRPKPAAYDAGGTWDDFYPSQKDLDRNHS